MGTSMIIGDGILTPAISELEIKRNFPDIFKEKKQKSAESGSLPSFYKKSQGPEAIKISFLKVAGKLEGHQDRVTGLAFSITLNALVSSEADGQICVWSMDGWNKQASKSVHISSG